MLTHPGWRCRGLVPKDMQQAKAKSIISSSPRAFSLKNSTGRRDIKRKRSTNPAAVREVSPQQERTSKVKRKMPSKDCIVSGLPGPSMATTTILNLKGGGRTQCQEQHSQQRKGGKAGG